MTLYLFGQKALHIYFVVCSGNDGAGSGYRNTICPKRKKKFKKLTGNSWQGPVGTSYVTQLEADPRFPCGQERDIITQQLTLFTEQTLSAKHTKSTMTDK